MSVRNGAEFLRPCLDGIVAQTFGDFECIILDDGSTDESLEIVRACAREDSRIRPVPLGNNVGLPEALNRGLALARGELVARIDADDICAPQRLAEQVAFLERHPGVGVLGTAARLIDASGASIGTVAFPAESGVLKWLLFFQNPLIHPSVVARRRVLEEVGGYDPRFDRCEDYELYCRLRERTEFANLAEPLVLLRKHAANVSVVHGREQAARADRACRRILAATLRRRVSREEVVLLRVAEIRGAAAALAHVRLVRELARAFLARSKLCPRERRAVRADAAARIWAVRNDLGPGWGRIHGLACVAELDPGFVLAWLRAKLAAVRTPPAAALAPRPRDRSSPAAGEADR